MLEKQKLWCKLKCKCFNLFWLQRSVARRMVSADHLLRNFEPCAFLWWLTLVAAKQVLSNSGPVSEKVFGLGKQVFKLRPACLESWSFKMFLNMVIFKWNRLNVISDCLTLNNSVLWFARKSHATFSPNQVAVKPVVSCTRAFFFRCAMIDPFGCLCSLWLAT